MPPAQRDARRGSHCRRWAPILRIFSRSSRLARVTAPPAITMLREASVPMPKGESAVSPWRTEIRAGSMPSTSCATWASVVSNPWPCDWMPDHEHQRPVAHHARGAALVARDERAAAHHPFAAAMSGLLGIGGEADADQPPVRLAAALACADRGDIDEIGAAPCALAGNRRCRTPCRRRWCRASAPGRTMFSMRTASGSRSDRARHFIDRALEGKARARAADAAIGADRRFVGGDGEGLHPPSCAMS